MRPIAIIPLLLTLVAFILSLLCVFAGSKRGYLENAHLLTVSFLVTSEMCCSKVVNDD